MKKLRNVEILLLAIVLAQIIYIVYFNLFCLGSALDSDSATLYMHIAQMVEKHSLVLTNWEPTSTMEIDCASILAIPIYFFTRNIYLSFGLANIIFLALFIYVIWKICKRAEVGPNGVLITLSLLLMPYSYGMLEYFNMLFVDCAQYFVKVLIPLLLILLLTAEGDERRSRSNIFIGIVYIVLLFISSMSSGLYVVLCGILPVILALALIFFNKNMKAEKGRIWSLGRYVIGVLGSSAAFSAAGFICNKLMGGVSRGNNMPVVTIDDLSSNIKACFTGLFQVFGAVATDSVNVITFDGIEYVVKMILVIAIIIVTCLNFKFLLSKEKEKTIPVYLEVLGVSNFIILMVCDTRYSGNTYMEYRYLLMCVVPLLILSGISLNRFRHRYNVVARRAITVIFEAVMLFVFVSGVWTINGKLGTYDYADDICSFLDENVPDAGTVTVVGDDDTVKNARIKDYADGGTEREWVSYSTDSGEPTVFDYYDDCLDAAYYSNQNVILLIEGTGLSDVFSEYIANSYEKIGTVRWFDVYVSDVSEFDYVSGFPMDGLGSSVDFPYSPGYTYTGSISDSGALSATGEGDLVLLSGELSSCDDPTDITLDYLVTSCEQGGGVIGRLIAFDADNNILASTDLDRDSSKATISDFATDEEIVKIGVYLNYGVECEIEKVEFEVK